MADKPQETKKETPPETKAPPPDPKPTIGRVVLFAFQQGNDVAVERPARVVRICDDEHVELLVDLAGGDRDLLEFAERAYAHKPLPPSVRRDLVAKSSDPKTAQPNTWRYPPRV